MTEVFEYLEVTLTSTVHNKKILCKISTTIANKISGNKETLFSQHYSWSTSMRKPKTSAKTFPIRWLNSIIIYQTNALELLIHMKWKVHNIQNKISLNNFLLLLVLSLSIKLGGKIICHLDYSMHRTYLNRNYQTH